jgi:hypothetical protein
MGATHEHAEMSDHEGTNRTNRTRTRTRTRKRKHSEGRNLDIIPHAVWPGEIGRALSLAYAPYNLLSPDPLFHGALSLSLVRRVHTLVAWAVVRIPSELGNEALSLAASCARFVVHESCALDVPCIFSGRHGTVGKPLIQVCFCHVNASGTIERTLYYAMNRYMIVLVNCFYVLGHIGQIVTDVACASAGLGRHVDEIALGAESLRVNINQCAQTLRAFIHMPPCRLTPPSPISTSSDSLAAVTDAESTPASTDGQSCLRLLRMPNVSARSNAASTGLI